MRNLLFNLLLLASTWSFSQTHFQGEVRSDGETVPMVILVQRDSIIGFTDIDGKFSLQIEENTPVIFRRTGYKEVSYSWKKGDSDRYVQIDIIRNADVLDDVVVIAGRYEQRTEESAISIDVLKPYLIQDRVQTDIEETFQQASGVNITDGQINIRSGSGWSYGAGSRVLMLLDEMPLISPDAGQAQWRLIPTEAVSQMEIVKGAASSLYGSSAVNGIINVRTLSPTLEDKLDIQMYQGVYGAPKREELKWWDGLRGWTGLQFNHTFTRGNNKQYGWVIAGQGERNAGYNYDVPDHRTRLLAKFKYFNPRNPHWEYEMMATGLWSKTGDALLWNGYNEAYIPLDSLATHTTGVDFFIDPKLTYHTENGAHVLRGRFMAINNNAKTETQNYENYSKMSFVEYLWQQQWNRIKLVSGASGQFGKSQSELFGGTHGVSNSAVYVQGEYGLSFLKVTGGVRYEQLRLDDQSWSRPVYRFGLNGGTSSTRFRASYGEGFRFPTMAEMFTRTSVGALQVFPNYELKPESGYSLEVGIRQLLKLGFLRGYIDIAAFEMEYQDMMEFSFGKWGNATSNPFDAFGFKSINVGATQIRGLELTSFLEFTLGENSALKWMSGVTWMDPKPLDPTAVYASYPSIIPSQPDIEVSYQSSSSNPESGVLKYRYTLLAKSDLQWDWKFLSFGCSYRYNDFMQNIDQIFVDPLFSQFIPGVTESREAQSKGIGIWDARMKYRFTHAVSLSLVVNNLLNEEYNPRPAMIGAPRSYVLQLRYNI